MEQLGWAGYDTVSSSPLLPEQCPVCKAPKNAFSEKAVGGANFLVPILAGLLALGGAAYYCVNNLV